MVRAVVDRRLGTPGSALRCVVAGDPPGVPFDLLPQKVKQKYRGSACIDATPLRIHSRGRSVDAEDASTDPDGGFYVRTGDHSEIGESVVKKGFFAFDINLIVAVDDRLEDEQYLPALPLAMHLDRPGVGPAGASRRMFGFLAHRKFQPRYLAGDGLYALADPATFQNQARSAGWSLVLPVLDADLGIQATVEGFHMIEGHWYCPIIPAVLIDATRDFRAKTIDLPTYETRIAERAKHRARLREDKGDNVQRFGCPASGTKATVMCANKPAPTTHCAKHKKDSTNSSRTKPKKPSHHPASAASVDSQPSPSSPPSSSPPPPSARSACSSGTH